MRIYVHLAHGSDVERWRERWAAGDIIGLNDESPYGYHRAAKLGADLSYSSDATESLPLSLLRKAVRVVLGFDAVHAWRNRSKIFAADVVWTHTESQHLAVAAVLEARRAVRRQPLEGPDARPQLIAQSVWLFDNWSRYSATRKWLYRRLMSRADVLTVLSSKNRAIAQELFPDKRVEEILFGVPADVLTEPTVREGPTLNVLGVGNDRHRDWETLLRAASARSGELTLKIVSGTIDRRLAARHGAEVVRPTSNDQLHELYAWADVAVVPLRENQHASGITAVEEAAVMGVPVVATDVGGLRDYFTDGQVRYVPPGDPEQLAEALTELAGSAAARAELSRAAQKSLGCPGLSSESYVRSHVALSEELLQPAGRQT